MPRLCAEAGEAKGIELQVAPQLFQARLPREIREGKKLAQPADLRLMPGGL